MHRMRAPLLGDPVAHSRTEMGDLMVPDGQSSQAKAAEEGSSRAMGERAGQKEATMTYPTEDRVCRIVGRLLRNDYRGQFFCSSCLVKLARESLDTTYPKSEIERAMDTVFQSPGALRSVPTFLCAGCRKTMPCLGAPSP
jgi:hypothetical protein